MATEDSSLSTLAVLLILTLLIGSSYEVTQLCIKADDDIVF